MKFMKYKGFRIKPLLHIRGSESPDRGRWVLGHYILIDEGSDEVYPVSHAPEYCDTKEEALELTRLLACRVIDSGKPFASL